jgi:hypothetical protein
MQIWQAVELVVREIAENKGKCSECGSVIIDLAGLGCCSVARLELDDNKIGVISIPFCSAALNIGSLGFFWYDLPRQTSHYYEQIRDLDAPKMGLAIGRAPGLLGDWKQGALSEKNLDHAIKCIAAFGSMSDEEASPIFGPYIQGLSFLANPTFTYLAKTKRVMRSSKLCAVLADILPTWMGTATT